MRCETSNKNLIKIQTAIEGSTYTGSQENNRIACVYIFSTTCSVETEVILPVLPLTEFCNSCTRHFVSLLLEGEQKTLTRLSGQTSMLIKLRIHHRVTGGRQGIEVSSMMCKQRISLVQPPLTRPYILPLMLVFALSTAALCHSRLSLLLNSSVLLICCEYVGMRFEHLCCSYHA